MSDVHLRLGICSRSIYCKSAHAMTLQCMQSAWEHGHGACLSRAPPPIFVDLGHSGPQIEAGGHVSDHAAGHPAEHIILIMIQLQIEAVPVMLGVSY